MNRDIKNKIVDNIVNPVAIQKGYYSTIGTIMKADEKNNTCTVDYQDSRGNIVSKKNVPVLLTNGSEVGWFPKKGDIVCININDTNVEITSKYSYIYSRDIKEKKSIKQNKYSNYSFITHGNIL